MVSDQRIDLEVLWIKEKYSIYIMDIQDMQKLDDENLFHIRLLACYFS